MKLDDYVTNKPILNTNNLILRAMNINDVDTLREWMPNKELYKYWGKNPGKADKNPELLFEKVKKPTKSFHFGIEHKVDKKVIGEVWVYKIENNRMAQVAYRVSDKYHNKGYATEAMREVVKFCFENTELQRLWSGVDVRNTPSWHVMEKCGFLREGKIRQGKMGSSWCDYYLYGMIKEDYLGNK